MRSFRGERIWFEIGDDDDYYSNDDDGSDDVKVRIGSAQNRGRRR